MTQNWIKSPIDNLAKFIALSTTLQGLMGVATATAALEHIYFVEAPPTATLPRVIVGADGGGLKRTRYASSKTWSTEVGDLWAFFDVPTPEEYQSDLEAAAKYHFGILQAICDDLEQADTVFAVTDYSIDILPIPAESEINKGVDYWISRINFSVR